MLNSCTAANDGARSLRSREQCLLHLRMREGKPGKLLRCGNSQIAKTKAHFNPLDFTRTTLEQHIEYAELPSVGYSPDNEIFSANALLKMILLFQHKHLAAPLA